MSDVQDVVYKTVETPAQEGLHIQDQIISVVTKRIQEYSNSAVKVLESLGFTESERDTKEYTSVYKELLVRSLEEHRNMEYQINMDLERIASAKAAEAAAAAVVNPEVK